MQITKLVDDAIRAHPANASVQFKARQIIFSLANSKGLTLTDVRMSDDNMT